MKSLLLRADNTPWASAEVPIFFADRESRESMIVEKGLKDVRPASILRVIWEWYRIGRSFHGSPAEVDLGDISEEPADELSDEDILSLIQFCIHENLLIRDARLQLAKKYIDGSRLTNATVLRILAIAQTMGRY